MPLTLPEVLLRRFRLTWARATLGAAVVFLLLLAVVLLAEGISLEEFYTSGIWRAALVSPTVVLYFMAIFPWTIRARLEEAQAFRPLVNLDDAGFQAMLEEDPTFRLRNAWLVTALGFAFGAALRLLGLFPSSPWLNAYTILTSGLMWASISLGAYTGMASPPVVTLAQKHGLRLDLFDLSFLQPVARNALIVVLIFVGGITVTLFYVPLQALLDPVNLILYLGIAAITVWIFFQSMRGTHRAIVAEKQREIVYVRRWMTSTYQRLQARAEDLDEVQQSTAQLRAWLALEQRLLAVPEWPYDTRTLRSLFISILVPIISVLARMAIEKLF